jgi:hypothetical protein
VQAKGRAREDPAGSNATKGVACEQRTLEMSDSTTSARFIQIARSVQRGEILPFGQGSL